MNDVGRRIGLALMTALVTGGTTLAGAPAAWAGSGSAPAVVQATSAAPRHCRPEHTGPRWRWHDTRRDDHWDRQVWRRDRHDRRWEKQWIHVRWDDRYCARRGHPGPGGPGWGHER
jgi:hypothetical protein